MKYWFLIKKENLSGTKLINDSYSDRFNRIGRREELSAYSECLRVVQNTDDECCYLVLPLKSFYHEDLDIGAVARTNKQMILELNGSHWLHNQGNQ